MNINTETIKASVSAIVIIVVAFFSAIGIEVDSFELENVLGAAVFLIVTGYGVWKNHNFTSHAQEAQQYLEVLKAGDDNLKNEENM